MTDDTREPPAMSVTILPDVVPLTGDFGETATVPEALREALFAGEAATFAILDAARVPGLPELLETSGLDHRCLFKGAAEGELRDVAPWLVRLEEHHPFTRHLFTPGDAPWAMWDREPGIFLRSGAGLDDLRRHFRRFTKMRDDAGKWYYVRFWEPRTAHTTFAILPPAWVHRLFAPVTDIYTVTVTPSVVVRRLHPTPDPEETSAP